MEHEIVERGTTASDRSSAAVVRGTAGQTTLQASGTPVRLIRPATLAEDGYMLGQIGMVGNACFRALQEQEYAAMRPGHNAQNKLGRKVGWGAFQSDRFVWSGRREYSLPAALNPEEGGAVRSFDVLGPTFLQHPTTEAILRAIFGAWAFEKDSSEQLYQVQLSAIRYEPTLEQPALPSPIEPHQDMVDGAIVLLARTANMVGGKSRIYDLARRPIAEMDLEVGDVLFVRDAAVMHQVTPLLLEPGRDWHLGRRAFRDVLLVRFQPVGR